MSEIAAQLFTAATLAVILTKVAPILLAAIGGAFTQQADVLNIGLEGMMLIGAFTAVVVGDITGSALVATLAAIGAGLVLSLIYAFAALNLKADFIVVGIGVNILALGLTVFLLVLRYGNPGATPSSVSLRLPRMPIGPLANIPVLGEVLVSQTPIVYLAFLSVPLFSFVLYRTSFGVHLRAVGEDPGAAAAAGIGINRMKLWAILIAGAFCGLAGAQLALATLGAFIANMTAGRGFIALAALTFGLARPTRTLIAALIFGAADAVADQLGVAGLNSSLALMTPYIITILALVLVGVRAHAAVRARRNSALKELATGVPVAAIRGSS